jgi:hypothetical protein
LQVYAFMGHGNKRGGGGGMSSKEQQAVMDDFKQPGCRLLISTSAGEEGIDVPRCEFVIRYSASQTGGWAGARVGGCAAGWLGMLACRRCGRPSQELPSASSCRRAP